MSDAERGRDGDDGADDGESAPEAAAEIVHEVPRSGKAPLYRRGPCAAETMRENG